MKIFVDPSINDIGYAIFEDNGKLAPHGYGAIRTQGASVTERLASIDLQLTYLPDPHGRTDDRNIVKAHEFIGFMGIDTAVVEVTTGSSYFKRRGAGGRPLNQAALETLNQAIAVIKLVLVKAHIKVVELPAGVWKRRYPARQTGQACSMTQMVAQQYHTGGVKVNEHVADAICMGEYWFQTNKLNAAVEAAQRKAV
jgi:Holliday junction resolvasome RuvABC endonuclease subunit